MATKLFGVFDDEATFSSVTDPDQYDLVLAGEEATVGVADVGLGIQGRTTAHESDGDHCVVWGEAFFEGAGGRTAAAALLDAYRSRGDAALDDLNGSYLAYVECAGDARVYTDQARTWECYYTDDPGFRVFGTDAAQVAQTIRHPTTDREAVRQFAHFGNVFQDQTCLDGLERIPFDGYLEADNTGELRRFVYAPREFDYVGELADRLERAIRRRSPLPGETGLLLSAGYDSRIILSQLDGIDRSYSLGRPESDEVAVARQLTDQYGSEHEVLAVDDQYLQPTHSVIRYTQGLRESIHIHHRGNNAEIDADSILHGMFFDTLFRGFFLPWDGVDLFGHTFPRDRLAADPDPVRQFADKLGCFPSESPFHDCAPLSEGDWEAYARETIEPAFEECYDRADSVYNAMDLLGIKLKPTLPFRTHLADHYMESFVAVDAELLEWHCMTPPAYRNDRVFRSALKQIDPDILRHRPPNRPYDSFKLNQIEKFLRRKMPIVDAFERPLPDRDRIYNRNDMDERLFPECESIHALSPRIKLRVNDAANWLNATVTETVTPTDVLCPPSGSEPEHDRQASEQRLGNR